MNFQPHPPDYGQKKQSLNKKDVRQKDVWQHLGVTQEEFQELVEFRLNHEARNNFKFFMMGVLFLPVTLAVPCSVTLGRIIVSLSLRIWKQDYIP